MVAAESLGVGSCYIGDILENVEEHRCLLDLPDYVMPAAMVVYGYPTEQQKPRKKPQRFSSAYIVPVSYTHLDVYKRQPWACAG